jgi:small subunit ribosomal protein S6
MLIRLENGKTDALTAGLLMIDRGLSIRRNCLMRVFEVLFIVAPNVEEADVEALATQISEVATNQGAKIAKVDRMGRRRLAYSIQKNNSKFKDGHYIVLTIEGTGAEIAEIERRMRVTDSIIRYITIRIDEDLKRAEKFRARRAAHARPPRPTGGGIGRRAPAVEAAINDDNEEEDDE